MIGFRARCMRIAKGSLDYFRYPQAREPWGGPFNNQAARRNLFETLRVALAPAVIVETGAFRGSTTEYLGRSGLPVFSAELDLHAYGFSLARTFRQLNVKIMLGDSRSMLKRLMANPRWTNDSEVQFFYLDAHWGDDLPLAEEIDIIFSHCPNALVMIDDFAVPDDPGYGFDDYGPGKALNFDYIQSVVVAQKLFLFYPSTPSAEETGARRGCLVLAKSERLERELSLQPMLRRG
jgi:hypothetical protein